MRVDQEDGPTSSAGHISATKDRQTLTAVRAFEERFSSRTRYLSAEQVIGGATAANTGMALGAQITPPCKAEQKHRKPALNRCQVSITCGGSTSITTLARFYFKSVIKADVYREGATDGWMMWRLAQAWQEVIPPIAFTPCGQMLEASQVPGTHPCLEAKRGDDDAVRNLTGVGVDGNALFLSGYLRTGRIFRLLLACIKGHASGRQPVDAFY